MRAELQGLDMQAANRNASMVPLWRRGAMPISSPLFFGAVALLSCLAQLPTATISPPAWQDEVQIIDYGRTVIPGSDLSFGTTLTRVGRVVRPLEYVGCLIQEAAYRIASGSMIGPRVAALAGALCAAIALWAWLKEAGVEQWIAGALGCAFLWDPIFAQSYRGAQIGRAHV